MRTTVVLTVLALLLCGAGTGLAQQSRKPVTHTVTIDASSFSPATLSVAAGDTVVWVNKDVIPHTATSQQSGGFDSGTIAAGGKWTHTFTTSADIPYICQFHPTMKGTLKVKR